MSETKGMKKLSNKVKITIIAALAVVVVGGGGWLCFEYSYRLRAAVLVDCNLKVYPKDDLAEVAAKLDKAGVIRSADGMLSMASLHDITDIKPGNYELTRGMSYRTVLRRLRVGAQTPVRVTFNSFRTVEGLVGALARKTLADSVGYMKVLDNDSLIGADGFNRQTVLAVFVPNTYEIYWTITPEEFYFKMRDEYRDFWDGARSRKAKARNMSPIEVAILASIVSQETNVVDEMEDVAGVYLNRLKIGMPLQADPTVKFAVGDPTLRRILHKHLAVESPYNTYKHAGLPPGLIAMPSVAALDAVLSYGDGDGDFGGEHDYLYFCANADFSGRHAFARTLDEHNRNAAAYARELNRRGIR